MGTATRTATVRWKWFLGATTSRTPLWERRSKLSLIHIYPFVYGVREDTAVENYTVKFDGTVPNLSLIHISHGVGQLRAQQHEHDAVEGEGKHAPDAGRDDVHARDGRPDGTRRDDVHQALSLIHICMSMPIWREG